MIIIIDACTLINLVNGEVLSHILHLPKTRFLISGIVVGESKTVALVVKEAIAAGLLGVVNEDLISMSEFTNAKDEWSLGDGETECILAAVRTPCHIACDDSAARKCAKYQLGPARVTGSIGLLQMAVRARVLSPVEAMAAYINMRKHGGFLPELTADHFEELADLDSLGSQP